MSPGGKGGRYPTAHVWEEENPYEATCTRCGLVRRRRKPLGVPYTAWTWPDGRTDSTVGQGEANAPPCPGEEREFTYYWRNGLRQWWICPRNDLVEALTHKKRHRWEDGGHKYRSVCSKCGLSRLKRPHPHARRWYVDWTWPDGRVYTNEGKTPPCPEEKEPPAVFLWDGKSWRIVRPEDVSEEAGPGWPGRVVENMSRETGT